MIFLQTYSYNIQVAKVFGVQSAVYLKCIEDELCNEQLAGTLGENNTISLSRAEIYNRTALDDTKQMDVELSLTEVGVIVVRPFKNIPNKNYYIFNAEQFTKIMTAEDPSEILGNEKAKQFIQQTRVEPPTKRQSRINGLKKKITVEDQVVKSYMCDWIDSVFSKNGFLSPTGVTIAQEELLEYTKGNQAKQIAILKIAIKDCLRDLTWAIERYEKQNPTGTRNFMEYNDNNVATKVDVNEDEVF